jgi:hypothetical protein
MFTRAMKNDDGLFVPANGILKATRIGSAAAGSRTEYCVPWDVVDEIVSGVYRPEPGCIRALRWESIPPADLNAFGERCRVDSSRKLTDEDLDPHQLEHRRYLDHSSTRSR